MGDPTAAWSSRERPWLTPYNRRLRHVQSISLRNLNLTQAHSRPRRTTIDDEALPTSLRSPAKILALRESKTLGHSRSSSDLRPISEAAALKDKHKSKDLNGSPKTPVNGSPIRPRMRPRRRSTMDWMGSNPQKKQERLEDVAASKMADVFFSLHVKGLQDAIYVSEVVEQTMNPDYGHIELDGCGPSILRADSITIKFWVKSRKMDEFQNLLDMSLNLRSLQFIGKELASFNQPFPPNCVLFRLTDGFYTCFTDAQVDEPIDPFAVVKPKVSSVRTLPTASFDALLRLSKLDDSIQDALSVRDQLANDLNHIMEENKQPMDDQNEVMQKDDFQKTIDYARSAIEKQLRTLRKARDQRQANLEQRRKLIAQGRQEQKEQTRPVEERRALMEEQMQQLKNLQTDIQQQRRRICEDLQKIYVIEALPGRSLAFSIRDLHLPNSEELDSATPDTVAAALGHVAHVVQLLSFYLSQTLPYPVNPRSSTSTVVDTISVMNTKAAAASTLSPSSATFPQAAQNGPSQTSFRSFAADPSRTFPLFSRSGPKYRFEYGLFLLNKDIELLLSSAFNVRVLDIRHTLPNLLYAIYCATAGEGELPARKAGGVRGLLHRGKRVNKAIMSPSLGSPDLSSPTFGSGFDGDRGTFKSRPKMIGKERQRSHLTEVKDEDFETDEVDGGQARSPNTAFESLKRNKRQQDRRVGSL